jgi:hypothetical protein
MKKIRTWPIILLCFLYRSDGISQGLKTILFEEAYNHPVKISASDFMESFSYIPLETSNQCLIGANPDISLTENEIIVTDRMNCFIFDKKNGKFIRKIGVQGREPGGYKSTQGFYSDLTNTLYFLGWNNNLIQYSLEGKVTGSIRIPNYNDSFTNSYLAEKFNYEKGGSIVCNILNINGLQKTLILGFDEKGNEKFTVPNYYITKEHKPVITTGEINFFGKNGDLFFNEIFNDTIFTIKSEKAIPYLVVKREKLRVTKENRPLPVEKIWIKSFFESKRFIMFNILGGGFKNFFSLYDKSTSALKTFEINAGIQSDLKNPLSIIPKTVYKEELAGIIQPLDLSAWFKISNVTPESISPDLKRLGTVEPSDNPIVFIARLKQ